MHLVTPEEFLSLKGKHSDNNNNSGVLPEMDQPRNHKFPNFVLRLPDGSP